MPFDSNRATTILIKDKGNCSQGTQPRPLEWEHVRAQKEEKEMHFPCSDQTGPVLPREACAFAWPGREHAPREAGSAAAASWSTSCEN
jgi:hypothetical protein